MAVGELAGDPSLFWVHYPLTADCLPVSGVNGRPGWAAEVRVRRTEVADRGRPREESLNQGARLPAASVLPTRMSGSSPTAEILLLGVERKGEGDRPC